MALHPSVSRLSAILRALALALGLWAGGAALAQTEAVPQETPSPAESLKKMQTAPDLAVDLVLAEPVVAQPLQLSFDERGRLWVVEYRQYPYPAGLKMVSRDNHWRAVYDKVPPPPPYVEGSPFRGTSRISIHEDGDGDGTFESHKVFLDGLSIATSVALGGGGVWVLHPPYLLFFPDRDSDDIPDGPPEVHLEGFGLEDTHSVAGSLRWGPDGRLYGAQGSTVSGAVKRFGTDDPPWRTLGQNIWRYDPRTHRYEVFAEGGGNAQGLEMDGQGRVFSGHNGGDTRGFHYVQGGYFQKGFAKHGPLTNPYAFGYFPFMAHHAAERFTHTFVIYEEGALPQPYQGKLFGVESLQGRVVMSDILPARSTFQTKDLGHPLVGGDGVFRPVDIKPGPDGALYVADFCEHYISHRQHFEGKIEPQTGRVWRIRAKGTAPGRPALDLGRRSTEQLLELLKSPSRVPRETALRLIADRRDPAAIPKLTAALQDPAGAGGVQLLWALNLSGGFDEAAAAVTLTHPDPQVRLWTVRFLSDSATGPSKAMALQLAQAAGLEQNIEVRIQLAATAKRLEAQAGLAIVRRLLEHDADAEDDRMPLMIWWAIEAHAGEHRDQGLGLLRDPALWNRPLVQRHILARAMRRYAATGRREDYLACDRLLRMASDPQARQVLLGGFEQAMEGRIPGPLPPELEESLAQAGGGSLALRLRRSEPKALQEAAKIIADEGADVTGRIKLVQVLAQISPPSAQGLLLGVLETKQVGLLQAALSALGGYTDPQIAQAVLARLDQMGPEARSGAMVLLASRPVWTEALLAGVEAGAVKKESVPQQVVAQMRLGAQQALRDRTDRLWPGTARAGTETVQRVARIGLMLAEAPGDPWKGQPIFMARCGACHRLFTQGGQIGPDLTPYQRRDLEGLLLNILEPSAEIREGFENYLVLTRDGRALTGFLADQDPNAVVLRTINGQDIALPRSQIARLEATGTSLMPQGLLDDLSDQDLRDLMAFLRLGQPLTE